MFLYLYSLQIIKYKEKIPILLYFLLLEEKEVEENKYRI